MRVKTNKSLICFILVWQILLSNPVFATSVLHHDIQVNLDPATQRLHVTDRISLPEVGNTAFLLHQGLNPRSLTAGVEIIETGPVSGSAPLVAYRLSMPEQQRHFTLDYSGKIAHQLTTLKESPGRISQRLSGTISKQGIFLDASTGWYPYFPDSLHTFELNVELPKPWLAVSQGEGPKIETHQERTKIRWREKTPQDDIYLIAAPYHLYRKPLENHEAQVFLRQDDTAIADRYLQVTDHYLQLYQTLIGPYPYAKFAMVENFWESGYGMPSFTLLGPRVLRLPFILHTSYPHEILHNWWGNSVYIDYQTGNWAEGLTSYLADHLLAEQRGQGANHRRTALQRYRDFIRSENDFPLIEFRGRHSTASQAVGYDKSLMFFHMLRRKLGDAPFIAGLRSFYRNNRFKTAGYEDLRAAFEQVSGQSLKTFFQHWTERNGFPSITVQDISVEKGSAGYRLHGTLLQTQQEPPFPIEVPFVVQQTDGSVSQLRLFTDQRKKQFVFDLASKPTQLDIDPWFDLFRQLDPSESPPTLSRLFGSDRVLMVIPSKAPDQLLRAYRNLAQQWSEGYQDADILLDSEITQLPKDRPIWLLGWENRFLDGFIDKLKGYPFALEQDVMTVSTSSHSKSNHSFALTQHTLETGQTIAWIASQSAAALPGLTRKLPHYGKYSYLAFEGERPEIRLKGQWPITQSPLRISFSLEKRLYDAPEPAALVTAPQ
ncbi:MAG: M1 family peptidase [Candidatus Thiodiazotropha sp.]|nr:M1 family peptidase [Candidatus Thiodiazotropha sp.]MCM8921639.1 M1 family peptidase [Candidatus Thiodiazotropha sp.]